MEFKARLTGMRYAARANARAAPHPAIPATHAGLRATPRRYSIRTTGTAAKRAEGTRPPSGKYDWDHIRYGYYLTSVVKGVSDVFSDDAGLCGASAPGLELSRGHGHVRGDHLHQVGLGHSAYALLHHLAALE